MYRQVSIFSSFHVNKISKNIPYIYNLIIIYINRTLIIILLNLHNIKIKETNINYI